MNAERASQAVVAARLQQNVPLLVAVAAASALVGFLQPHFIGTVHDPLRADILTRTLWLAGPIFFGTLLGIIAALAQRGTDRLHGLELCEQSAPLYGRQLARATALVPCIIVTFATLVNWFAQYLSGFAAPPVFFLLALAAVITSTLVALSATLREGGLRWLYVAISCAISTISFGLAIYVDTLRPVPQGAAHYADITGIVCELAFCAIIGFIALRQYGEALARYDPLPRELNG
ncbi:MAG: hypothetical protein M3Y21_01710 [Candidatus Eremiobacteraeota bacterium]|nr:hypothetical protein [Candidatus Eremiobacteraeota bacterium]